MNMRMCGVVAIIAALAGGTAAKGAFAQAPQPASPAPLVPIPFESYVGINPLGIPFDIFAIEGETGVAQGITVGGVASYTDFRHDRYTSFDFKARYYPGEVVLRDFSAGVSLGYLNYSTPSKTVPGTRDRLSAPTLGLIADYNWFLGTEPRFVVGTGAGIERVLANSGARQRVGLDRALLTARFTVGLAF
jgi:hypothetical protein